MKKLSLFLGIIFLVLSSLSLNSCKKKDILKGIDLTINGIQFKVDSLIADGNPKTFTTTIVTTGIEAKLQENNGSLDKVESIDLKSLKLTINAPGGHTFDGIEYIEAYISAGSLSEIKIAYNAPIPQTGLTSIDFDSDFAKLAEYIKQTSFELKVIGYNGIDLPGMTMTADISFTVNAKVPKK